MGSKFSRLISHGLYGDGAKGVSDKFNTAATGGASEGIEQVFVNDNCDEAIGDDEFNDFNSNDSDNINDENDGRAKREAGDSDILDAIEDIQKMSRDEINEEFERVSRQNSEGGSTLKNPCYDTAHKLMDCVRRHPEQLTHCFSMMDAYRSCISHSYREKVELFLDKDFDLIFPSKDSDPTKIRSEKDIGEPEQNQIKKKKLKKPIHPPPMLDSTVTKEPQELAKDDSKTKEKANVDDGQKAPWYQWPPWK